MYLVLKSGQNGLQTKSSNDLSDAYHCRSIKSDGDAMVNFEQPVRSYFLLDLQKSYPSLANEKASEPLCLVLKWGQNWLQTKPAKTTFRTPFSHLLVSAQTSIAAAVTVADARFGSPEIIMQFTIVTHPGLSVHRFIEQSGKLPSMTILKTRRFVQAPKLLQGCHWKGDC